MTSILKSVTFYFVTCFMLYPREQFMYIKESWLCLFSLPLDFALGIPIKSLE